MKGSGSSKATKKFETQREAIAAGREIAKNQGTELLIHRRDGRIRRRNLMAEIAIPRKDDDHVADE